MLKRMWFRRDILTNWFMAVEMIDSLNDTEMISYWFSCEFTETSFLKNVYGGIKMD